jgi:hypothetical protein
LPLQTPTRIRDARVLMFLMCPRWCGLLNDTFHRNQLSYINFKKRGVHWQTLSSTLNMKAARLWVRATIPRIPYWVFQWQHTYCLHWHLLAQCGKNSVLSLSPRSCCLKPRLLVPWQTKDVS